VLNAPLPGRPSQLGNKLIIQRFTSRSDHVLRMFLIQLFAAADIPLNKVHMSPGMGMVLRGQNVCAEADLTKRHEGM
jgi:hypothetical protein